MGQARWAGRFGRVQAEFEGNSLICSFLNAVVFPCQFSDFPSDSLSSLAGPLVFHSKFT